MQHLTKDFLTTKVATDTKGSDIFDHKLRALRNATLSENINQHVCHRVQRSSGEFQGSECGEHLALKVLVMDIQRMKVLGRTTAFGSTDPGQYRFYDLLAQD